MNSLPPVAVASNYNQTAVSTPAQTSKEKSIKKIACMVHSHNEPQIQEELGEQRLLKHANNVFNLYLIQSTVHFSAQ